ncbi:hypothetical protein Tco_0583377 [Tanacetum coccineum]
MMNKKETRVVTNEPERNIGVRVKQCFDVDVDEIKALQRVEGKEKKLKQIKKAKEMKDNIVHKALFPLSWSNFASADDVKERVRLHSIETRGATVFGTGMIKLD